MASRSFSLQTNVSLLGSKDCRRHRRETDSVRAGFTGSLITGKASCARVLRDLLRGRSLSSTFHHWVRHQLRPCVERLVLQSLCHFPFPCLSGLLVLLRRYMSSFSHCLLLNIECPFLSSASSGLPDHSPFSVCVCVCGCVHLRQSFGAIIVIHIIPHLGGDRGTCEMMCTHFVITLLEPRTHLQRH